MAKRGGEANSNTAEYGGEQNGNRKVYVCVYTYFAQKPPTAGEHLSKIKYKKYTVFTPLK
jgi:hypothetical protein